VELNSACFLSARPISDEPLRRSLEVTNQIQRQVTAAIQFRGNFAVAITDRVSEGWSAGIGNAGFNPS
jgi:hypothetical protein